MRRLSVLLIAVVLVPAACPAVCAAQPSRECAKAPEIPPTELRVLVACLSAYSDRTRKEAFDKLMAYGDAAEQTLREKFPAVRDEDARLRYQQLLERIEIDRRGRELLKPTFITLHAEKAPASEVFASIYRQAGASVSASPPHPWDAAGDQPVTVHFDDVPFWEAVRELQNQTGLTLLGVERETTFAKVPPEQYRGSVAMHGPFMLVAPEPRSGGANIEWVGVFLEPKIKLAWYAQRVRVIEACDQFGGQVFYGNGDLGRSYWDGEVLQVQVPPQTGNRRVVYLKGVVVAELITRLERVRFTDIEYSNHFNDFGRRFSLRLTREKEAHVLRMWDTPRWNDERDVAGVRPLLIGANDTALPASGRTREGLAWQWTFAPSSTEEYLVAAGTSTAIA
jgi:hypothetical protein